MIRDDDRLVRVSERERVAHVLRRLSMGTHPDRAASLRNATDAVAVALDLSGTGAVPPPLAPSDGGKPNVRAEVARLGPAYQWWFGRMAAPERLIEERLTWFWTDHFATSLQKVRSADLMWQYHATIRKHSTGSFAELLHAVAKDGAMLVYLDGLQNSARERNENFAREVMELHTMGAGHYTQADVVDMARSCTGWVVKVPSRPATTRLAPAGTPDFGSYFAARRHDDGTKTLFGTKGDFDLDGALVVILAQPATANFVSAKLYGALVGAPPTDDTVTRLAATFRRDWSIMALVDAIVAHPAFLADLSVRTIFRSPVEKLVGAMQATGTNKVNLRAALVAFRQLGYVPFFAPNPAGYPKWGALLGPQQLVHAFDLQGAVGGPVPDADVLARFATFDASPETRAAIAAAPDPQLRTLLALGSPEFAVR
jgi:uncharacterized protein (DUF1800 family)